MTPGTRIGAYEILSILGAGGMGEVYRARDTQLGRDVAIKVVAESLNHDPTRVARFRSEAQLLAALNHPHIATIHGFEEAAGNSFLVMELVEGETLADRLKSGALLVSEALGIARQIADALQAAHEKGIIHRDLKPANIALTPNGQVKILDFGLAKVLEGGAATDLSVSPTLSLAFTQAGVIVGTAAYMSPEQARGRRVDKRSDVWAFGCVLYEMLTGRRAFDGEDAAVVLASVIKGEPDWSALPADVPLPVLTLLRNCLEKDPHIRIGDVAAATFVLNYASQLVERIPAAASQPLVMRPPPLWRRAIPIAGAVVASALVAGAGVWQLTRPLPPAVVRMTMGPRGPFALFEQGADRDLTITPDGSRIIYRGNNQLVVRALSQIEPSVLSGLGSGPRGIFSSPDDEWVGFFDSTNLLKKVAITGGPPVTLATPQGAPRGATWSEDGTIVFATSLGNTGLFRVSAAGGDPAMLTKPDAGRGEFDHLWPEFLPGGKAVLFTISPVSGIDENAQVAVLDLQTGTTKVLIRGGSNAHYVRTGHVVYAVGGTLRAVAFDLGRLEVVGAPVPVLQGVLTTTIGAADFDIAANGSLVYVAGAAAGGGQQAVVSVDPQGHLSAPLSIPADAYRDVRVSPDGTRLALATSQDVWIYDLNRATLSRLTTNPAPDTRPLWTPDSQRIVFTSSRAGYPEIFWRQADGTGSEERLIPGNKDLLDLRANGWSPDGKQLLITEVSQGAIQCVLKQVAIEHPSDVKVLVKNEFCDDYSAVSPDGRWLAYHATISGRSEIYVERYPELGNRQQVSTGGAQRPVWSHDGRTLFFSSLDNRQILAATVRSGATFVADRPQVFYEGVVFSGGGGTRTYDITPDGRFFLIRSAQAETDSNTGSNIVLVLNWTEELKRLVPVN